HIARVCKVVAFVTFVSVQAGESASATIASQHVGESGVAGTLGVFPRSAAHLKPRELADFVADIVPGAGFASFNWAYLSDGGILWITEGLNYGQSETIREGLARIRVNGRPSTRLRRRREELAWTLSLVSEGNPKFGPEYLRLEIGLPPAGVCFGTLDDGCDFTASDALASRRIAHQMLCEGQFNGNPEVY